MNAEPNKKQCSRQLQCEVPCGVGNVISSSLFINSSLSSLSSTSHAVCRGAWGAWVGGGGLGEGGLGTFQSNCHIHVLHYNMVLRPKGTSLNEEVGSRSCDGVRAMAVWTYLGTVSLEHTQ